MPPHSKTIDVQTPWPIEVRSNPGLKPNAPAPSHREQFGGILTICGLDDEQAHAEKAFQNPQETRHVILETVRITPERQYEGEGFTCVWLTKFCPVGCACCFFGSPSCGDGKNTTNTISEEGIDQLLALLEAGNTNELVVAGGGEPFLEMKSIARIAAGAKAKAIFLSTSGIWAKTTGGAERVVKRVHTAHQRNPHGARIDFRISLDRFHADRIEPGRNFNYIMNLVNLFRKEYRNDPNFALSFHSMDGDEAMEEVIKKLPIASRTRKNEKTEVITLDDGFTIEIRWKRLFHSDPQMDLKDMEAVERNTGIFEEDINVEHKGNMSVAFNPDGSQGPDLLIHYDGSVLNWGANAPDNESSLYTDTYDEIMRKALADVLSLSMLEKGNGYRETIIAEVNPYAVQRAKAINLRDFYGRLILEEEKTRLYLAIRVIQDYLETGRIPRETMETWPTEITRLVSMPKEKLMQAYHSSPHNIVTQYLSNPKISKEDLLRLYNLVRKGHYEVSAGNMILIVKNSEFPEKEAFLETVRELHAKEFSTAMETGLNLRKSADTDTPLASHSNAIWMDKIVLAECGDRMAATLPPELQARFRDTFRYLTNSEIADTPVGEHPITTDGEKAYAHVQAKNGKGRDNAPAEVHRNWVDIQCIVAGAGDVIGFNTSGSTSLRDSIDEPKAAQNPKREGRHLKSPANTWRRINVGDVVIIPPMTPHAPSASDPRTAFKRVVGKVSVAA